MPVMRAQVVLPYTSGHPEDVSVNVWHFRTSDKAQATFDSIADALQAFYNGIRTMFPSSLDLAGASVRFYDLADAKPRPPLGEQLLGLTPGGLNAVGPSEVAICLSFHGTRIAGVNPARQRGRIYLGPCSSTIIIGSIVPGTTVSAIIQRANELLTTSNGATWDWVIYSQALANDPAPFVPADTTVVGGWVDNEWDTQRRRGTKSTIRVPFGQVARALGEGRSVPELVDQADEVVDIGSS